MEIPDSIVDWFFERAADVLDAVTDSYSDQEAEQAIAWALEQAYLSGLNYGRNNPKK